MQQREKVLSALSRHQIKVTGIRGNRVFTQNDFCIEMEEDGLYRLSQGGFVKANYKDSYKMCEAITTKKNF